MRGVISGLILVVSLSLCYGQAPTPDHSEVKYAEETLKKANIDLNDATLIRFFQQRTLSEKDQAGLDKLVEQLGSPSYKERTQATARILKYRDLAIPYLLNGLRSDAQEIVSRSGYCLSEITQTSEVPLALAAVKVLSHRKPAQTAPVLLAYLPFTNDQAVIDEIRSALKNVLVREKAPDPFLLQSLQDPLALRRLAAGEALAGHVESREKVVTLLNDPVPEVRLHVALALARAEDTRAIPTLIALLDKVSSDKAWLAEDTLLRIADKEAPEIFLGGKTDPGNVRKAWEGWWQANKDNTDKLQLARLTEQAPYHGYTLVSQMGLKGGLNGEILEYERDSKTVRWKITGLRYPVDARVIRPNRVLIAEYFDRKVTERDFEGNVLWSYAVQTPVGCQRLTNGHTFIVSRQELLTVDQQGNRIFHHVRQGTSFVTAQKLANGQVVYVDSGGQVVRLDAHGKELSRFFAGNVYSTGGRIDVLNNGHILVPHYRENKVVEYSSSGDRLWQAEVPYPTAVSRLPNGHTLVVSLTQRKILELNQKGQQVWEHQTEGRPWCAYRR